MNLNWCVRCSDLDTISLVVVYVFFFKQKTAYEIKECDWSSDVCSSDLHLGKGLDYVFSKGDEVVCEVKGVRIGNIKTGEAEPLNKLEHTYEAEVSRGGIILFGESLGYRELDRKSVV